VLTLDHQTMPGFVRDRVSAGLPTTGIILVHTGCSLQTLVEDLHIIVCCAKEEELSRIHVQHVPLS